MTWPQREREREGFKVEAQEHMSENISVNFLMQLRSENEGGARKDGEERE